MADTTTPLVNLALLRIGADTITSYTGTEANALKAKLIYPYILQRVLQAKDWRFAKLRVALTRHTLAPLYGYKFAYLLPTDFLRLCASHFPGMRGINPVAYPPGYWYQVIDTTGYPRYYDYDPRVYPGGFPFVFEVIKGTTGPPAVADAYCLLTDYDNTDVPLYIDYIRSVTDESVFTPAFSEAFICRLAQEFAITITESQKKKEDMQNDYNRELLSAEAINESFDDLPDEAGSTAWENAGR